MNHAPAAQRAARSIALIAAALLSLCVCLLALPATAHAARTYGQLCEKYESNGNPYALDDSDPYGGNVFGAYQMSSGNAVKYAQRLCTKYAKSNPEYAKYGEQLLAAYEKDGKKCKSNFCKAWKAVFPDQKSAYYQTQYNYVKSAYYTPAKKLWEKYVPGFDADSPQYSNAIRNVIFSTAVQHGVGGTTTQPNGSTAYTGSVKMFVNAISNLGGYSSKLTEEQIIAAVYAERSKVVAVADKKQQLRDAGYSEADIKSMSFYKIKDSDIPSYLKNATTKKLVGKCLSYFYSNPGVVQVGVFNRLGIGEPAAAKALLESYQAKDYAISYQLDGGTNSADNPASHKGGTTVSLAQPEKQGYRFLGWFTKAQGKGEQVKSVGGFTTASVYAFWEKVVFQISYQLNGGALSGSYKNEFHVDDKSFKLPVPTRSGYLFQGWYTTKSFKDGTQISKVAKGTAEDLKVYAKWVKGYYAKVNCKGGLTIRAKASTSAAAKGLLKNGSKVIITKTSKGWGKLAEGGWVKLSYTKKL
ncbi:MAG: InlB B-repeat-containing protein [Coriobacteriaceae bacterium]|nr:InlB B-repeat-containing protein [Coriobacteriaceae bacterium]